MTRFRRWLRLAAFVALFFAGLLVVAVAMTQTAWFKDWLRRYVTRQAEQYLNARLVIDRLGGNLFTGIELEGVSLVQGDETIVAAKDVGLDYNAFDFVSAVDRVSQPMIREGAQWRHVSWNEARAFVVDRIRGLIQQNGPDSIAVLGSARATNEDNYVAQKFARLVITSRS